MNFLRSRSVSGMLPLIDDDNPMYCPDVSAQQYMASVRLFHASLEAESKSAEGQFPYFHKLRIAFDSDASSDANLLCEAGRKTLGKNGAETGLVFDSSALNMASLLESPITRNAGPAAKRKTALGMDNDEDTKDTSSKGIHRATNLKTDFSDSSDPRLLFGRPAKRVKRSSSEVAESFVLSTRAERLQLCLNTNDLAANTQNDLHDDDYHSYWPDSEMDYLDDADTDHARVDRKQCTCGALKHLQGPFVLFVIKINFCLNC